MDNYLYQCRYCGKQYKPKRRYKQLFCSNSCRVNSFNKKKSAVSTVPMSGIKLDERKVTKNETMTWAGVGNGAAGVIAVNALTHLLTKEENRPATKKDVKDIIAALKQKHFIVKNMQPKPDGSIPYFDIQTCTILYVKPNKTNPYGSL